MCGCIDACVNVCVCVCVQHKDAALQCLGVLEELMKKRHELKGQLQALVAQHVLPEFTYVCMCVCVCVCVCVGVYVPTRL
jgi:hypothetical protein